MLRAKQKQAWELELSAEAGTDNSPQARLGEDSARQYITGASLLPHSGCSPLTALLVEALLVGLVCVQCVNN